ncbi:hypothetical protein ONZ45_g2488 [Pleurotus djamor]|nr:hypothetical protein ONZ45_g2488 [Pleurotus djamor]
MSVLGSSSFNLDRTIGAPFLGNIAAGVFFGITSVQTFIYYKKNFHDRYLHFGPSPAYPSDLASELEKPLKGS